MFRDRLHAGQLLAEKLGKYNDEKGVVLAVPRGGVPVAYMVAKETGMPLDLVFTKKIGHPFNEEFAIGAASLDDYFIEYNEGVSDEYIQYELRQIRKRLREMQEKFGQDRELEDFRGKTVIIIDDGVATGNTLVATIKLIRKKNPFKIVVAVPVASDSAVRKLMDEQVDVITCLVPEHFYGVGAYYADFSQVSDKEVLFYLEQLKKWKKAG